MRHPLKLSIGLLLIQIATVAGFGQGFSPVELRIASTTGTVLLSGMQGQAVVPAGPGMTLFPGSSLDTRGGGRAVVSLSDGSMVTIEPNSVVTFKDFRQASSLRELFEITLGQVRVKINHFAGRPNPYRMNSPTASIAVRGTEFKVSVEASGKTSVVVIEGTVEVTSLEDPAKRIVLETGQGLLVTPGFGMQLFAPTARDLENGARAADKPGGPGLPGGPGGEHDQPSPRAQAGTYELYLAGLESLNSLPLLLRYSAIPEAYLDSAENPAYATQFTEPQARIYLLPSLRGTPDLLDSPVAESPRGDLASAFAVSTQVAGYVPFGGGHFVVGGSATASYYSVPGGGTGKDRVDPGDLVPQMGIGSDITTGKSISRFIGGSVLLASRSGANSFGIEAEALKGTGSLTSNVVDEDFSHSTLETSLTRSDISQIRLTFGYQRQLGNRHTLGAFARYAFVNAKSMDGFNLANEVPQPLSRTVSPGHSSEAGVRLRGEISPRWFYGLQGAWTGLSLRDALTTGGFPASAQRDRSRRIASGLGAAYVLNPRTILAADIGVGFSNITAFRYQDGSGLLLQNGAANGRFQSVHIAVQRALGKRIFTLASFVNVWSANSLSYSVFPDNNGNSQPLSDAVFSVSPTSYLPPHHLSDFGAGYRLTRNILAQYTFSTNYSYSSSSHTLMLRYTIHGSKE